MTGTTGFFLGMLPVTGIEGGWRSVLMTGIAVARVLRKVADRLGIRAIQIAMVLVHYGRQRTAGSNGRITLVVTGDTEFGVSAIRVFDRLLHVTTVTTALIHDIPGQSGGRPCRHPVQHIVGNGNIVAATKKDTETMGRRLIPANYTIIAL